MEISMKTLKDYIKLLEDDQSQEVIPTTSADDQSVPDATSSVDVYISIDDHTPDGYGRKYVRVNASLFNPEENNTLLRNALKIGGVPMPDEPSGVANKTGINVSIDNGNVSASAFGDDADELLAILAQAGLTDSEGNPLPGQTQEPVVTAGSAPEEEQEEEITEESSDAVQRVIELSREVQRR